jgi:U3 small nucleolar RNA-associated protein 15
LIILNFKKYQNLKKKKDYIRCGVVSESSDDLILTGSYDHYAKMIDTRTQKVVISVDHGEPIENVLLFPSSNIIVSCGGNSIKLWDVLKGGSLMRTMINHHKTVTSLALSQNCKYLLSGGLDRHVKVFDLLNYDLVHTIDYPSPILSLAILV